MDPEEACAYGLIDKVIDSMPKVEPTPAPAT
jgi:ATP-dependent protease ClpP protease subunit